MRWINPADIFHGTVLITVPHMDDCVLSCGGTIAKLPRKERIHVVYVTDGMASPAPVFPWRDCVSSDLGKIRMEEARAAMRYLGVPEENIRFLAFPDGKLRDHIRAIEEMLTDLMEQIQPAHIMVPFRYDRHGDHLALNDAVRTIHQNNCYEAEVNEYFVYYRWRLLPKGDIRKYIRPEYLIGVNIEDVEERKRAALDCFKSQTTRFYPWQTRPNLNRQVLDEVSRSPEVFLQYDASAQDTTVFSKSVPWIRLVHAMEPYLKQKKDQLLAIWHSQFHSHDNKSK